MDYCLVIHIVLWRILYDIFEYFTTVGNCIGLLLLPNFLKYLLNGGSIFIQRINYVNAAIFYFFEQDLKKIDYCLVFFFLFFFFFIHNIFEFHIDILLFLALSMGKEENAFIQIWFIAKHRGIASEDLFNFISSVSKFLASQNDDGGYWLSTLTGFTYSKLVWEFNFRPFSVKETRRINYR